MATLFKRIVLAGICTVITLLLIPQLALAQVTYFKTAAEKAKLNKLIAAVEADPDNIKTHYAYLNSINKFDASLLPQYLVWMKKFPKSATVPFALGEAYNEYGKNYYTKKYMLQAVALNPKLSKAWQILATEAYLNGDPVIACQYSEQALATDTLNANLHLKHAFAYEDIDSTQFHYLLNDVVKRFPKTNEAITALYWLVAFSKNYNDKISFYEQLMKQSVNNRSTFDNYMTDYFNYQLQFSHEKALEIAEKMASPGYSAFVVKWQKIIRLMNNIALAEKLIANNNTIAADSVIHNISLPDFFDYQKQLFILKARLNSAKGNIKTAYDSLAAYYSRAPDDSIKKVINEYGMILGYDNQKVVADIAALWNKAAWPQTNFTLTHYGDDKPVSLSDFKGKVVLLTYWFPSCGPCNLEFPHFEDVLKKFDSTEVVYLAINILKEQNNYVVPFVKKNKYTFTPLRGIPNKAIGNMPAVQSVPENYIFDTNGRIVFSNFRIFSNNKRMLELMISGLLELKNGVPLFDKLVVKKDSVR